MCSTVCVCVCVCVWSVAIKIMEIMVDDLGELGDAQLRTVVCVQIFLVLLLTAFTSEQMWGSDQVVEKVVERVLATKVKPVFEGAMGFVQVVNGSLVS